MNTETSPTGPAPEPRERASLFTFLAKAQAFTFSTLLHAVIIVVLGTSVLMKVTEEPPDFAAEGGELVSNEPASQTPPPSQPELQTSEFSPTADPSTAASVSTPTLMAALTTSAQSNISINAAPVLSPTLKVSTEAPKTMTPTQPSVRGQLSKEMAGKIAGFTSGWAKGGTAARGMPLKSREFQFTAYLAKYQGGDWASTVWFKDGNPPNYSMSAESPSDKERATGNDKEIAGGSLPNLLYLVGKLSKGKIHAEPQAIPLDLASDDIYVKKPPFIWFTGHRDFKLTDKEVENLAEYLRSGGCLWGDSSVPGHRSRFDIAFRREMLRLVPPGEQWFALPPNHPIYAANYFTEIKGVAPGVNFYDEPVYALIGYGGSIAVLYTANDYGDMWQFGLDDNFEFDTTRDEKRRMVAINEEMWHRRGLYFRNIEPKSLLETYKFGTNIIVHLLTRWEDKVRTAPKTF